MKGGGRGRERYRVQCQHIKGEGGKDNSSTWGKGVRRRKGRNGVRKVVNDKDSYKLKERRIGRLFKKKKRMAVVRKKGKEGRMATELRGDGQEGCGETVGRQG